MFLSSFNIIREKLVVNNFLCKCFIKQLKPHFSPFRFRFQSQKGVARCLCQINNCIVMSVVHTPYRCFWWTILHSALGILGRDIEKLNISVDDYPSASDVSIAASMDTLPQSLVRFLCWLIDAKSFESATEPYTMHTDKIRKALSITGSLVSVSKQLLTPFHLWLTVQLYH